MNLKFALICKTCGAELTSVSFYRGAVVCQKCMAKSAAATFHQDGACMITTPLIVLPMFGDDATITGALNYLEQQRQLLEQKGLSADLVNYTHGNQPEYTIDGIGLHGSLKACADSSILALNTSSAELTFLLDGETPHFAHVNGTFAEVCSLLGAFSVLMSNNHYTPWKAVDQMFKNM